MRTSALFTTILMLFCVTAVQSQQLSPNFYRQFKDILNTDWETLKGNELNKENTVFGFALNYNSKKNIDGFKVSAQYIEEKSPGGSYFEKRINGVNSGSKDYAKLFEKIKTELSKLKNEGFELQFPKDTINVISKKDNKILTTIDLFENIITIQFYKSYTCKKRLGNGMYEGDYLFGGQKGKGKFTDTGGGVYEGDFIDEQMTGKGKYKYANGTVYEGDFVDGKFAGKGLMTFSNGDTYLGDFKNGLRNGKGKFTFTNGKVLEGNWEDDSFLADRQHKSAEEWSTDGREKYKHKKYEEAITSFTKSIELEPNNPFYYTLRGFTYIMTDNPAYKKDFEKAISLDPKNVMTYYLRGSAFATKGKNAEAVADYRKVLEIDPNHKAAKEELEKITGEKVKQ